MASLNERSRMPIVWVWAILGANFAICSTVVILSFKGGVWMTRMEDRMAHVESIESSLVESQRKVETRLNIAPTIFEGAKATPPTPSLIPESQAAEKF